MCACVCARAQLLYIPPPNPPLLQGAVNSVIPQEFPPAQPVAQPVAQTYKATDKRQVSQPSLDSPLLRMPVKETQDMQQQMEVESDSVPGFVRRNPAAEPGPDMPELPLPWHSRGEDTTYSMATDDVSDTAVSFATEGLPVWGGVNTPDGWETCV